jgi:LacI family transcriptional regulator
VTTGYTRAAGSSAVSRLLATGMDFDAVVAVNDLAAIGALDALRAAARSVPGDVAVVGFDDIDAAALVHPSLTTVDNRAYEKGALCGRLLMQRLSGELTGPFRQIVVPGSLVIRESA